MAVYCIKIFLDLYFAARDLLFINRLQHLVTSFHRRFSKSLALSQLEQYLAFLKFLFVLLKGFVDVFAIFGINNKHIKRYLIFIGTQR